MLKDFSVLKEDFNNHTSYIDVRGCPAVMAFKRQFPEYEDKEIIFGDRLFDMEELPGTLGIARLITPFGFDKYLELKEGKEFHTQIEIYEPERVNAG